MAPLIILLATFLAAWLGNKFLAGGRFSASLLGRIALAAMLVVTGIAHFTSTDAMVAMMPDFVPLKREMVYFTGVCELAGAAGLLWKKTSRLAAIMLVIFSWRCCPLTSRAVSNAWSLAEWSMAPFTYGFACRCRYS
jgi:uncharacterized membrane protein YphA (DoxX/SURF4 family)